MAMGPPNDSPQTYAGSSGGKLRRQFSQLFDTAHAPTDPVAKCHPRKARKASAEQC